MNGCMEYQMNGWRGPRLQGVFGDIQSHSEGLQGNFAGDPPADPTTHSTMTLAGVSAGALLLGIGATYFFLKHKK